MVFISALISVIFSVFLDDAAEYYKQTETPVTDAAVSNYFEVAGWSFSENGGSPVLLGIQPDGTDRLKADCINGVIVDLKFGDFGWRVSGDIIYPIVYQVRIDGQYIGDVSFASSGEMFRVETISHRVEEFLWPSDFVAAMYAGGQVITFTSESDEIILNIGSDGQVNSSRFVKSCESLMNFIRSRTNEPLTSFVEAGRPQNTIEYFNCNFRGRRYEGNTGHSMNSRFFVRMDYYLDTATSLPLLFATRDQNFIRHCQDYESNCDLAFALNAANWPENQSEWTPHDSEINIISRDLGYRLNLDFVEEVFELEPVDGAWRTDTTYHLGSCTNVEDNHP